MPSRSGSATRTRYAGLQTTSMVTSGYGAGSDLVAGLGVVGPDPHGLPHDDGRGARRRHLRLPDPRRVTPSAARAPPVAPATRPPPRPEDLPPVNDYYADLGVARDATPEDIKRAYRKAARRAAPRRQPRRRGRGAVQEGLPGLRRALRRREAPLLRHGLRPLRRPAPPASARASRFSDIMDAFFGGAARRPARGPRSRMARGQDALVRLDIDLGDAVFGGAAGADDRDRRRVPDLPRRRDARRAPPPAPATCATAAARSSRSSAASSAR